MLGRTGPELFWAVRRLLFLQPVDTFPVGRLAPSSLDRRLSDLCFFSTPPFFSTLSIVCDYSSRDTELATKQHNRSEQLPPAMKQDPNEQNETQENGKLIFALILGVFLCLFVAKDEIFRTKIYVQIWEG